MTLKQMIKDASIYLINGQVKQVSEEKSNFGEMYEVGEDLRVVRVFKKKGCTMLECSCRNGTLFPSGICKHKIATIMHMQREVWK
jgi:hypothetical protein